MVRPYSSYVVFVELKMEMNLIPEHVKIHKLYGATQKKNRVCMHVAYVCMYVPMYAGVCMYVCVYVLVM